MRPAAIVAFLILTFLPPFQATPASGFFHSGAEIVDIRVLDEEWICVVRDPTRAIALAAARRHGAPRKFADPQSWKRLAEMNARIDEVAAEARAATLGRDSKPASWLVDNVPVREVALWIQSVGAFPDPEYPEMELERPRLVEYFYLRLPIASSGAPDPARAARSLTLCAPDGSLRAFALGSAEARCWSLKVDQEGYLPAGPKIAFFGMWLGTRGAMPVDHLAGKSFFVIPEIPVPAGTGGRAAGSADLAVAFRGTIRFRSRDSQSAKDGMPISGEDVCELDFSALEKPGRYMIHIPGIGSSFPFSIGEDVFAGAFFATARALYHQRCGVALGAECTSWTRDACHTRTFAAAYPPDNGEIYGNAAGIYAGGKLYGFRSVGAGVAAGGPGGADAAAERPLSIDAFSVIRSTATDRLLPGISGGHHDAADYDRRSRHFALTWYLCGIQELFPDRFADGQLGIPESGNGIPDILDEAAVDVDLWMKAQTASGGAPGWIEQTRHPTRFETAASDRSPCYLSLPDRASSFAFAAAAALLSRRMAPFAGDRAAAYLAAAEKAYLWASDPANRIRGLSFRLIAAAGKGAAGGGTAPGGLAEGRLVLYDESPLLSARGRNDRLLAALQLAAATATATGKKRYLADFRNAQPAEPVAQSSPRSSPPQTVPPAAPPEKSGVEALLAALPDAIVPFALVTPLFGGILEKAEREKLAQAVLREAELLISGSESLPYRTLWRPASHGYFGLMAWGSVHGGVRSGMEILAWKLTGSERYKRAMLRAADWELGANELGTSMITGLGSIFPVSLQHIQSDMDGIAEPVPGLAPFSLSYGIAASAKKWQFGFLAPGLDPRSVYPIMRRRFIHPFLEPGQNEFTVMESIAPQAALFGALLPSGWMPPAGLATRSPRPEASLVSRPQP
jgi:endoglucanase